MSNKLIVSIGNDHGGVDAKFYLIKYLREREIEVIDEGTDTKEAGLIYNDDTAHLVKEHNHANVITFGAKFFTGEQMARFVQIYMDAEELGDRHQRRVDEIE